MAPPFFVTFFLLFCFYFFIFWLLLTAASQDEQTTIKCISFTLEALKKFVVGFSCLKDISFTQHKLSKSEVWCWNFLPVKGLSLH